VIIVAKDPFRLDGDIGDLTTTIQKLQGTLDLEIVLTQASIVE
jgi:hypothetical protein